MESPNLTTLPESDDDAHAGARVEQITYLALVWCRDEPWRIGEALVAPAPGLGGPSYFGRGLSGEGDPPKTHLMQLRPGLAVPCAPLSALTISRYQVRLQSAQDTGLLLENVGRAPMLHNGTEVSVADCQPGDLLQLGKQLLFLCVREPAPTRGPLAYPEFVFGEADAHGLVGESAPAWRLRQQIAFAALRRDSVLVQGDAGSGKELAVRAVHALSARSQLPLFASLSAGFPEALVDLELFGSSENYPSAGNPERQGLLAEADGASLFVREFERLPAHTQEQLLRSVEQGARQRLGDRKPLGCDVRLLAASGAQLGALSPRAAVGFGFTLRVPDLNARRRDIPLLVRHTLRREAERGDELAQRCFSAADWRAEPTLPLHIMRELLELHYTSHVRELKACLWQALAAEQLGIASSAASLSSVDEAEKAADAAGASEPPEQLEAEDVLPSGLNAAFVQAALDQNNGVLEATWRALGLKNRFVLLRLIKRYDLEIRKRPALSSSRPSKR
ncbi:MAG: sigma 54-interacting transcriptional regulator [Pseudomonadota bacterium]